MPAEVGAASAVNPAAGSLSSRVFRRVRVPEHDLVEIDRLGLRAPVAVDAEARLCVDEGRAVAADAIFAIGQGSLVGAAERTVEPDVDAGGDSSCGIPRYLFYRPVRSYDPPKFRITPPS